MPQTDADARADAYRTVRRRVDALLRDTGDLEAVGARRVPDCPGWTVQQTLSHLVGVCSDLLVGRSDAAGSPSWTAAQVAARQGQPVAALLEEWARTSEQVVALLAGRSALGQVAMDAVSHEYDLRTALGVAPPDADPVVTTGLDWLCPRFGRWLDSRGIPALRAVAGDGGSVDQREWLLGTGEPAATVRAATAVDLLRSLTGRRSLAELRALDWQGDPDAYLPAFTWGPFVPPRQPA